MSGDAGGVEPVLNIDGPQSALHSPWPLTTYDPRLGMVYPPLQTSLANGRQVTVSQGGGGLQGYFKVNCCTLH